jgi:Bacterial protein of unknown function (DUF922)
MMKTIALLLLSCLLLLGSDGQYLEWNAEERLAWEDFSGPIDPNSNMKAWVRSTLHMSWACDHGHFKFDVVARFDKDGSWKKENRSAALLAHEQLHFDIAELHARKMRRHFARMPDACRLTDDAVRAEVAALTQEWRVFEARYDVETRHSLDREAQSAWEQEVRDAISHLQPYAHR